MTTLFDPLSAGIVIVGTVLAALLRCGWQDSRCAMTAVWQLFDSPFDSGHVRAQLAVQIREIEEDGLVRAQAHRSGDGEFDELSEALIRHRSIASASQSSSACLAFSSDCARRSTAPASGAKKKFARMRP